MPAHTLIMKINYSRASIFLIILLLWNIFGWNYIGTKSDEPFFISWTVWILACLFLLTLYLLDLRRNKNQAMSATIGVVTQRSKIADLLLSLFTGIGSILLIIYMIENTTDLFNDLGLGGILVVYVSIAWLFIVATPVYFFILRMSISTVKKLLYIGIFILANIVLFWLV